MKEYLHWFTHSAQSGREPQVQALIAKYGMEGYGRYWVLMERIASSGECLLDVSLPLYRTILSHDLGITVEELQGFVQFLTDEEQCGLLMLQDGKLTSRSIQEDYARVCEERRKARERRRRALQNMEELEFRGNIGGTAGEVLPNVEETSPKKTTQTNRTNRTNNTNNTNKQGSASPHLSTANLVDNSPKSEEVVKEAEGLEVRGSVKGASGDVLPNTEGKGKGNESADAGDKVVRTLAQLGLVFDKEYLDAIKLHLQERNLGVDYLEFVFREVKKKEPTELKPYYFKALYWPDLIERFHTRKRNGYAVLR